MTRATFELDDRIPGQVAFWSDPRPVIAYVGGLGSGKTFAGAVKILGQPPGSSGVVVAPTYPLMRDASQRTFFEICPHALIASHNKAEGHTRLVNGIEIFWRSADKPDSLRGPNLGWAWVDEAAFITEAAWKVIIGRLRRRPGKAWVTTTPMGQNWLYQWFVIKPLGYGLHHGATADNPHNLPTYAADLARQYADDPLYAAQELSGQFVDLGASKRFPALLIAALLSPSSPKSPSDTSTLGAFSLPPSTRVYQPPVDGRRYVVGADCAEGVRGGDDSTGVVLDVDTGATVAILAGEYEPQEEHGAYLALLSRWYGAAPVLPERNNHGHAVIGALHRHGVRVLTGPDGRPGWLTTAPAKADMYAQAHRICLDAAERGDRLFPDARLAEQVKGIDRTTLKGPGKGRITKVDDEATAWALAQVGRTQATARDTTHTSTAPPMMRPVRGW